MSGESQPPGGRGEESFSTASQRFVWTVVGLTVPPAVLVAGIYGASLVIGVAFDTVLFVVTALTMIAWFAGAGNSGTMGMSMGRGADMWNAARAHRGAAGTEASRSGQLDGTSAGIARVHGTYLLTPGNFLLLFTLAVVMGWIALFANVV